MKVLYICGLKGHHQSAQGSALGIGACWLFRPERAKALFQGDAFALSGRGSLYIHIPKAMPWAVWLLPFQGDCYSRNLNNLSFGSYKMELNRELSQRCWLGVLALQ